MELLLGEKKGKKYTVNLDGELYCRCYVNDLRKLGFSFFEEESTVEVCGELLAEFEKTVFLPRAKRRGLMLLGKKEYTRREMEKKLAADGYPESVVLAVLEYLSELHYVDDSSFAERYAFHLLGRLSEREIFQKMLQKSFSTETIKEAISAAKERYKEENSFSEAEEEADSPQAEAIKSFLRKKGYHPETTDEEKKKKLTMALYRKGFELSDIRAVLGEIESVQEF